MKGLDTVKAVGLAVLILALNFAATFAAVFVYATLVQPGRPPAFYAAAAPGIAGWSAPIGGALLFFAATYGLGRRRPARNGLRFARLTWIAYVIVDIASEIGSVDMRGLLSVTMVLSMGLALAGALGGAALARRNPPRSNNPPADLPRSPRT